jgi:hypothetical protein
MFHHQEYLTYLQDYQLLICNICKHALSPTGIRRHLQRVHKIIPNPIRQSLVEYAATLILQDESTVRVPTETIPAIPYLAPPIEGFRCTTCTIIGTMIFSRTEEAMIKHAQYAHGWLTAHGILSFPQSSSFD